MGSKLLKAVVVRGDTKVEAAEGADAKILQRDMFRNLGTTKVMPLAKFRGNGTALLHEDSVVSGGAPIKNWQVAGAEVAPTYKHLCRVLQYRTRKMSCPGCPVACKGKIRNDQQPYPVGEMESPSTKTSMHLACFASTTTSKPL